MTDFLEFLKRITEPVGREPFAVGPAGPAAAIAASALAPSIAANPEPVVPINRETPGLDWVAEEISKSGAAREQGDWVTAMQHGLGIAPGLVGTGFDWENEEVAKRILGELLRFSSRDDVRRVFDERGPQAAWDYAAQKYLPNQGFFAKGLMEALVSPSTYAGFGLPAKGIRALKVLEKILDPAASTAKAIGRAETAAAMAQMAGGDVPGYLKAVARPVEQRDIAKAMVEMAGGDVPEYLQRAARGVTVPEPGRLQQAGYRGAQALQRALVPLDVADRIILEAGGPMLRAMLGGAAGLASTILVPPQDNVDPGARAAMGAAAGIALRPSALAKGWLFTPSGRQMWLNEWGRLKEALDAWRAAELPTSALGALDSPEGPIAQAPIRETRGAGEKPSEAVAERKAAATAALREPPRGNEQEVAWDLFFDPERPRTPAEYKPNGAMRQEGI